MVLVVQRDVCGDGVFAAEAAVHTGAWSQSHTLLFLCSAFTQVHHRQLRQRLQHTKKTAVGSQTEGYCSQQQQVQPEKKHVKH